MHTGKEDLLPMRVGPTELTMAIRGWVFSGDWYAIAQVMPEITVSAALAVGNGTHRISGRGPNNFFVELDPHYQPKGDDRGA